MHLNCYLLPKTKITVLVLVKVPLGREKLVSIVINTAGDFSLIKHLYLWKFLKLSSSFTLSCNNISTYTVQSTSYCVPTERPLLYEEHSDWERKYPNKLACFPHTENGVFSRNIVTCTTVAGVTEVTVFAVENITCFW